MLHQARPRPPELEAKDCGLPVIQRHARKPDAYRAFPNIAAAHKVAAGGRKAEGLHRGRVSIVAEDFRALVGYHDVF